MKIRTKLETVLLINENCYYNREEFNDLSFKWYRWDMSLVEEYVGYIDNLENEYQKSLIRNS